MTYLSCSSLDSLVFKIDTFIMYDFVSEFRDSMSCNQAFVGSRLPRSITPGQYLSGTVIFAKDRLGKKVVNNFS